MFKKQNIALALLLAATSSFARTITPAEAEAVARTAFIPAGEAQHAPAAENLRLVHTATLGATTCFYAFDRPSGGFAIVAASDAAPALLGYCELGTFCLEKAPQALRWLLAAHSRRIAAMETAGITPSPKRVPAGRHDVEQILHTEWSQEEPFNNMIPVPFDDPEQCLATGCVATATAQVMKHFAYPAHGLGQHSYTCSEVELADGSTTTMTFSADFQQTVYDWANMLDSYFDANYNIVGNATEHLAVAQLMYHVGVAADMIYGAVEGGGSGTMTDYMAAGLQRYFDYSCTYEYIDDEVTEEEWDAWEEKIYQELAAGYPIIYAGEGDGGGHCFVLDGYNARRNMVRVNWGWAGTCDGFYTLYDGLSPSEQGTGGNDNGDFSYGQEMIYRIRPNGNIASALDRPETDRPQKVLLDGQLHVFRAGHVYDALGRKL